MPECQNCGGHITADFVRVFGVDGEAYSCPSCSTYSDLQAGAGTQNNAEP